MIETAEPDIVDVVGDEEDSAETATEDEAQSEPTPRTSKPTRRQLTISLRGFGVVMAIVAVVGVIGVLTWSYMGAQHRLAEQVRRSESISRAEKVALDYAVEAAAMNFQDLPAWRTKLVAGTSPELKDKLTKAATSMEQILVPLQWNSTARPLMAKVRSVNGGTYVVDSFVSVLTKTMQAPEPLQSTATYSVTIDSTKDWQIVDIGGVGDALGKK
ncbi:hypothetical protein [Mycobacterium vicinigordonae]|uniref:Mammalian cell entry protein n=1 Tax=Mycobacterium vicinigordonae TaxID=1719132 RepID=A0A7D6I8R2_9MYCO|nr:hypothetical protein [Mycobacterium vicinigordonae]QLL07377.1 hypothetical protein H0P51_27710 [Mycobacterium vicinigordonae]